MPDVPPALRKTPIGDTSCVCHTVHGNVPLIHRCQTLTHSVNMFCLQNNIRSPRALAHRYLTAHVLLILQILECSAIIFVHWSAQDAHWSAFVSLLSSIVVTLFFWTQTRKNFQMKRSAVICKGRFSQLISLSTNNFVQVFILYFVS